MAAEFEVYLSNYGNSDKGQNHTRPLPGTKSGFWVDCESTEHAGQVVRAYIEANGLGGGNWPHGDVRNSASKEVVGYISYNGRFWPPEPVAGTVPKP